jgi:hypothetical protein
LAPGLQHALEGLDVVGPVYGVQYEAADVVAGSPRAGARPVGAFTFDGVDVTAGSSTPYPLEVVGVTGPYQFFGFLDANGNANPTDPQPDSGDLLIRPVSPYLLQCEKQPIAVEFAFRQA